MNIQDEMQKIHHQYGVTEMANYKIQLFIDKLVKEKCEIAYDKGFKDGFNKMYDNVC
jgi:hypothetical protein